MIITVVSDVLGKENNGTTIAAMNLIRTLKSKGHEVRVICPDADRRGQEGFFIAEKMNFGIFNRYVRKNGVTLAKADKEMIADAIKGSDAVHVIIPFSLGKAAALYAHENGIALTAGFHCQAENITGHLFMKDFPLANRITYKILYNRVFKYCDFIHYPTQFICDVFEGVVGPTRRKVISNGVNSEFRPMQVARPEGWHDKYIILFTARYSPEKSHNVLVEAVSLSKHKDKIQLIFAGTGPKRKAIEKQSEKLGINPPIMRFFSRKELLKVINAADLYVHPAEIEIESIAALEAIACGKVPVIADSPRSATRYFALSDKNLFRYNDPQDLADKIDFWLDNPAELENCRKAYGDYSKKFDFDYCMDKMEEMIVEAVEMKRGEK